MKTIDARAVDEIFRKFADANVESIDDELEKIETQIDELSENYLDIFGRHEYSRGFFDGYRQACFDIGKLAK